MRLIISLSFFFSFITTFAQISVKGRVLDVSKKPVEGAIIKIQTGNQVIAYGIADAGGGFEITLTGSTPQLVLSVEAIDYVPINRNIPNKSGNYVLTITKRQAAVTLREVIVKAPPIYQRGDTLSYNLSSYIGKGDYSLKDAIKKLPGIDVTESGTIKYLGKQISNFYIDGLDLLGGKYNIATTNIPAEYVNTVQVLNNHQPIKMNKDVFSDDVAINIKMSDKVKFKPMGTLEASAGYGADWLYQFGGAAMLFKKKFQAIATAKAGTISKFAMNDMSDHLEDSHPLSLSQKLAGDLYTSAPPLQSDRYASPTDRLFTVNLISKLSPTATFRINTGYGYAKSRYTYSTQRDYYDGSQSITIQQQLSPESVLHQPNFSVEYQNNAETSYIRNTLSGTAFIRRSEIPTFEENHLSNQNLSLDDYNLTNRLRVNWRRGRLRWNITSLLQYLETPPAAISLSEGNETLVQQINSQSFLAKNTLAAIYTIGSTRLYVPFLANFTADNIKTALIRSAISPAKNDTKGHKLTLALAPQYEYTHPLNRFILRTQLSLRADHISGDDRFSNRQFRKWFFSVNPEFYFNYNISARSILSFQADYARTFGDLLDFLTAPVQTDLITRRISSGILADNKGLTVNLHYNYKIPLRMWFINTDVSYQRQRNNLLTSQVVTADMVTLENGFHPNTSHNIHAEIGITKQIRPIKTKISLKGAYTYLQQVQMQNSSWIKIIGENFAILPELSSQPCQYLEVNYSGNFNKTTSRYLSIRKSYWSYLHDITLKLFPIPAFQITATTSITRKEISDNLTKTMALLDAGITFRQKAFRFSLNLRNLLNQKTYAYTLYNSVNTYTYNYNLRGREVLFTISYTR